MVKPGAASRTGRPARATRTPASGAQAPAEIARALRRICSSPEEVAVVGTRYAETGLDIIANLRMRQGRKAALQLDPLLELPKLGAVELLPQLRLAHEQDLQKLLGRRLEVGEQADPFECGHLEVLGFVQHQHGALASASPVEQDAAEGEESLGR